MASIDVVAREEHFHLYFETPDVNAAADACRRVGVPACGWRTRYTKRPGERASSRSATIKGTRCISGSRSRDDVKPEVLAATTGAYLAAELRSRSSRPGRYRTSLPPRRSSATNRSRAGILTFGSVVAFMISSRRMIPFSARMNATTP